MQRGPICGQGSAVFTFFLQDISETGRSGDKLDPAQASAGEKNRMMNDGVRLWEAI